MKTTKKVAIVLAGIILALIVSPAIPYSEAGEARKVTSSIEVSAPSELKTIMIVGHEEPQFVPKVIHLKIGDSIRLINQDGLDGGLAHQIVSVDKDGIPDDKFSATLENSGDTYIEKFTESGIFHLTDSAYPQMHAILVVA